MRPTLLLLASLCSLLCFSQRPLSIGDKLPAVSVAAVLNNETGILALDDFKDNLLILDFMATSCISCIRALPRFDSLQAQFGKKIRVLLVSAEKKERVQAFLKNNRIGKTIRFPFIVQDTLLRSFFPHQFISHLVWIYKGVVVAVTRSGYVTAEHIETVLSGKQLKLPLKNDFFEFDFTKPLLSFIRQDGNEKPSFQFYSGIRSNIPGVPRSWRRFVDTAAATQRILFINYAIPEFYLKTYGIPLANSQTQLEVEAVDKTRFIFDPALSFREDWIEKNTYCYEAVFPLSFSPGQCMEKIRAYLDVFFAVTSCLEKRDTPYLILTENKLSNVPD